MSRLIKLLMVIWSCLMMLATFFLIGEYCYLVEQSHKLVSLKSEYENHLMAVSRIIYEYNVARDRQEYFHAVSKDGKKKTTNLTAKQ